MNPLPEIRIEPTANKPPSTDKWLPTSAEPLTFKLAPTVASPPIKAEQAKVDDLDTDKSEKKDDPITCRSEMCFTDPPTETAPELIDEPAIDMHEPTHAREPAEMQLATTESKVDTVPPRTIDV
jgi:hypothetical protein